MALKSGPNGLGSVVCSFGKGSRSWRTHSAMFLAASVGLTAGASGASIRWAPAAGGSVVWETAANWVGGVVPTSTSDAVFNSSTAYTFQPQVASADSVLGLVFGNSTGTGATVTATIANAAGGSIAIGTDGIAMYNGSAAVTISAPISFAAATSITTNATAALTISGAVSGSATLTKAGTSQLVLNGADTFSGGINLNAGWITVGSATALGSGTLTVGTGAIDAASVASANVPFFNVSSNSAVTIANNIVLPSPSSALVYSLQKNSATATTGTNLLLSGTISGGNSNMTLELNSSTASDGTTSYEFNASNPSMAGTVRVNRGAIILDNANAVGTSQIVVQSLGNTTIGNVDLNGSFTFANAVSMGTTASNTIGVPASNVAVMSGVFTTAVAWSKVGAGTLIFTGANAISAATTISAGTLQIGNGGTTGTLNNSAVTDNGTLAFNLSSGVTYSGIIGGTGSLSQLGGTTILTAANTYSGGTTISAGTLQVGNGSSTGSIAGSVTNNAALVFNESGGVALSGSIGGSGTLTQAGTGILSLSGTNSFTGLSSVTAGTLRFTGGTSQSSPINVSTGAALAITNGTGTNPVNGLSLAFLSGSTSLNLSAGSTWNPSTPLLALSGGLSTNGTTTISLASGAVLTNTTYDLATFSGAAGGTGSFSLSSLPGHESGLLNVSPGLLSVTISNAGDTTRWTGAVNGAWDINTTQNWHLVNANTATTYMEGDTVLFDDTATGTTSVSLATMVNPTSVTFNNSSLTYTISGSGGISGVASVLVQGTAPVILATNNTYTGGTTIASGAYLQIGNGVTGNVTGTIIDNGTVTFVPPVAGQTFASVISGTGSVAIGGSNLLSLTAANTFSGGVNLSGGSVSISTPGGLGTGTFNVGSGAISASAVSSTNVPFLTINSTAAFTVANNISLPSPITPLVYTLQKNTTSSNTGTNVLFSGTLTGGNANMTLELNSNTASDYSTSFELSGNNSGLNGIVRLNRGSLILDNANALGATALQMQTNPNLSGGNLVLAGSYTLPNSITITTANDSIYVGSSNSSSLSGTLTTAVAWTKMGAGTLTLTGTNAITAATNISAGTLQIGNGGTAGTLGNSSVIDTGILAFNHSDNVVYSGAISGTGQLMKLGAGTLSLTGSNTYNGSTSVVSGTLALSGGTTQASAINVSSGAVLAVSNSGPTATASDPSVALASGNTTLNFAAGSGWNTTLPLLTLTSGTLTDNGTTTINLTSGTPLSVGVTYPLVQYVGAAGGTGTYVVGTVPGRGAATISNSLGVLGITITSTDITKWTGAISNTWDINTTSNWQLVTAGTTTTYMEGDTVLFDNSASTTNVSLGVTVNPGSVLFNNNSSTYTLSGAGGISGITSLAMQGTGTTVLLTNNNYSGGTLISAGTLQIGNGATAGTITGSVTDNGTLAFNRSDTVIFAGSISGSGVITQAGPGTTVFTGPINTSGGLVISSGTAQVGSNGTTGTLSGPVTNNGTLIFNRSNASTVNGAISGSGTVIQAGIGTTTLGGTSSYTGGTLIQSGGIAISNTSALGTGQVTVGIGANSNTVYVSAEPAFMDLSPLGNGTFSLANNLVLPSGTFAGTPFDPNSNSYYAIQMNGSGASSNMVTLSGQISGGGPDTIFYLNNTTAGNSTSTWSITNSSNSFVGAVRVNRGSLSISSDGALGPDTNPVYFFDNAGATLEFQYSGDFGHPLGDGQNNVVLNAELNSVNLTGVISGSTGFIMQGLGTFTLAGANTVQGGFDLQGPTLNINNPNALGTGTFQIDQFQGSFNSTIDNTSGNPVTLATNNAQIWTSDFTFTGTNSLNLGTGNVTMTTGGRTITVAANTLTVGGAISDAGNNYSLTLNGPGTLVLAGLNSYTGGTQVNSGTLVLGAAGALPNNTSLTLSSGATTIIANHNGGSATVVVASSLNNSGTIDITNNAMIVHNGSISTLFAEVAQGYNSGGWNGANSGSGAILSSVAAGSASHLTAVGIATGLTSFEGATVAASDVLIKYTFYGDTNLDGVVDGTDYSRIDNACLANFNNPGSMTGWYNGDFNYDGVIDGSDYTLLDNAFNTQGAAIAAVIAEPTAQITGSAQTSAVPEPATLGILGIGAAGLLGRRRRN